jgi:hypothetical protein
MTIHGKTEKISVSLPRELVGQIRASLVQGELSAFCAEALEYYMAFRKQQSALKKGFGAWQDENHSDLATPTDSTVYVNSLRAVDTRLKVKEEDHAN